MGKINFETEVESVLSKQSATCDKLKIRVSDTVEGVSLSAKFVIPVNTSLSSKGADLSLGTSKVDLEAAKDFWKIKVHAHTYRSSSHRMQHTLTIIGTESATTLL